MNSNKDARSPRNEEVVLSTFIVSGGNMDAQELFLNAQRHFIEGRHKDSISAFTESIEAGGKTEIAFLSRGVAYLKTEQIDKAIEDFGTVLAMNNNNIRAYFYRGIAYMAKNDFEISIKDFDKTIELKPDHGAAFFARGSAYAQMGNEYEAARNIKTAIIFSETNIQGFSDTVGIFRTQFDKAMTIMADKEKTPGILLTEDEIATVRKWLEDQDQ
jgi:tetratricopeptide (TPR) repeat protein